MGTKTMNKVEARKTTLGDWNGGKSNTAANCYYSGKTICWGVWINDVKTIAFSRKCDAVAFKLFAEDTGYVEVGDPEMLFCKWLADNDIKDPTSKSDDPYDLDKIMAI